MHIVEFLVSNTFLFYYSKLEKIITFCAILLFTLFAEAQENKFAEKRAANAVSLITSNMDISDADVIFLKETLYNKYATNASKIRGKDLTDDEKRQIYRSAFKETRKKLMTVFTKDQVDKITEFEKMSFKK